jgi:hypothetical protein
MIVVVATPETVVVDSVTVTADVQPKMRLSQKSPRMMS